MNKDTSKPGRLSRRVDGSSFAHRIKTLLKPVLLLVVAATVFMIYLFPNLFSPGCHKMPEAAAQGGCFLIVCDAWSDIVNPDGSRECISVHVEYPPPWECPDTDPAPTATDTPPTATAIPTATATETPLPPTETATPLPPIATKPGGGIMLTEPPVEMTANPTADSTATSLPPTPTWTPVAPLPTDKPYPTERPTKLPTATKYPVYPTLRQAQGNAWTMTTQPTSTPVTVWSSPTATRKPRAKATSSPTAQKVIVVASPIVTPTATLVSGARVPANPIGVFALSAFALGFCFVALSDRRPRVLRSFARTLQKMKFLDD